MLWGAGCAWAGAFPQLPSAQGVASHPTARPPTLAPRLRRLCLGWLLAMAEMKALLAVVFRSPLTLTLLEPNEPWLFFPLARPKHGMPARFAGVPGGGPPAGKL